MPARWVRNLSLLPTIRSWQNPAILLSITCCQVEKVTNYHGWLESAHRGNRISAEFPKPVDYREEMIPRTAEVTIRDLAMKKFRKSQQFGLLELSTCSSFF
jgi:hypothetical protein